MAIIDRVADEFFGKRETQFDNEKFPLKVERDIPYLVKEFINRRVGMKFEFSDKKSNKFNKNVDSKSRDMLIERGYLVVGKYTSHNSGKECPDLKILKPVY